MQSPKKHNLQIFANKVIVKNITYWHLNYLVYNYAILLPFYLKTNILIAMFILLRLYSSPNNVYIF